jgi:hypothetical protein
MGATPVDERCARSGEKPRSLTYETQWLHGFIFRTSAPAFWEAPTRLKPGPASGIAMDQPAIFGAPKRGSAKYAWASLSGSLRPAPESYLATNSGQTPRRR